MSDYIVPRSVSRLEEELAELEKNHLGEQEEEQVVEQEGEEEEDETSSPPATTKEEETWKKRHGDLRRLSQKQAEDLKTATAKLKALEAEKNNAGLPSAEEAAEWAKTNPKAAAIIRALASEQVSSSNVDVEDIRWELEKTKQEVKIKKVHPDFEEITSSDEFHDWAEKQTKSVQNLIYTSDAEDVIWALNLFKKENDTGTKSKKDAARSVVGKSSEAPTDGGGKRKFSESQVDKMSLPDYEKNEEAIRESMKNGSFVYDLSGGAR